MRGSKAKAQRELRKLLSTLDRGIDIPDDRITLRDWLSRWMREVIEPHRRQATMERYRAIINLHIAPHLGYVEPAKLGPSHVHSLEAHLLRQDLSPATIQLVHVVLSGALKHAMRMELIHRNPASLITPPPATRRPVAPPDIAAVRRVLDLARDEGHHLFAAFHLIAYTGLRCGEARGLRWPSVDLDNARITVDASLVRTHDRGIVLEPPKTESGRRAVKGGISSPNPTPSRRARPRCSTLYQFAMTDSRFREVAAQRKLLQS